MRLVNAYKNSFGFLYSDCEIISLNYFFYDTRENSKNWARGVKFNISIIFRLFDRPENHKKYIYYRFIFYYCGVFIRVYNNLNEMYRVFVKFVKTRDL